MPVYRNQNRIVADVLAAVRDARAEGRDVTVTLVMRKSNLSYSRLTKLLVQLVGSGLLEERESRRYALSQKGLEFLRFYSQFDQFALSYGVKI
ncbi:MAG: winged helix-turn-helix domain-containing protein [Thaumarchaeota archaeon]|nr:hypothetical protein [Nitrososphaerota archaeon]MBI3022860.1 hypothetical protein [Nitrososphaerota archaeon]MBI3117017.1 hypothetical protein [Nitrososphaerota archaeon]MCS4539926.1 winged helix-turn-helix domain-containing protein [Nitrososphaerota archaeon]